MKKILALGLVFAALCGSAQANLLTNGGFEDDPAGTFITVPPSTLTGWTVGLVGVDVVNGTAYAVGPAQEGINFLDLDGTPGPGSISQSFATVAGAQYTLTFYYANNFQNQSNPSADVQIDGATIDTISHTGSVGGNLNWTFASYVFTATNANTTLSFISNTTAGGVNADFGGILLDDIIVVAGGGPVVPEPASMSVVGLGLAGLVGSVIRRRMNKVA